MQTQGGRLPVYIPAFKITSFQVTEKTWVGKGLKLSTGVLTPKGLLEGL